MMNFVQPVLAQGFDLKTEYGFGKFTSLGEALGTLVGPAFTIAAVAVVIYFLIGALKYLLSAGDKNATSSAREMITHAIIGFVLLMMLFLILQFVPEFLGLTEFRTIQ